MRPTVGKQSLTEGLPTSSAELGALVKPHAGTLVNDGGGYTFQALENGTFKITKAPNGVGEGYVISPQKNAQAWFVVARKLLSEVPPKPAPVPTSPASPVPTLVKQPPPPEPSLLARAMRAVDAELHELREDASGLWDRAASWVSSIGSDGAPAQTPSTPVKATPTATPSPKPAAPPQAQFPAVGTGNETDTLSHAMSRIGVGKTEYTLNGLPHDDAKRIPARIEEIGGLLKNKGLSADEVEKLKAERDSLKKTLSEATQGLAKELASGKDTVKRFYCSGLSIWSLAAVGYDVNQKLEGPDGNEYRGLIMSKTEVPVNEKGTALKKGEKEAGKKRVVEKTVYVTLKKLVDGDPEAVEIVTRAQSENTSEVELLGTGYQTGGVALASAAGGAAAAFEIAGIGRKVDELDQKPGDFAQSRHTRYVENAQHIGAGHAWQVAEVKAVGSALFGHGKSPESEKGKLDGWHENVPFIIKADTDPRLVGPHKVTAAKRVEAQDEGVVADKAGDTDKDGGVQLTGWKDAPDKGGSYKNYVVFYGRLGTSQWNGSTATKESAEKAAAAPAAKPANEAPANDSPAELMPSEPLPTGMPAGELTGGDEALA